MSVRLPVAAFTARPSALSCVSCRPSSMSVNVLPPPSVGAGPSTPGVAVAGFVAVVGCANPMALRIPPTPATTTWLLRYAVPGSAASARSFLPPCDLEGLHVRVTRPVDDCEVQLIRALGQDEVRHLVGQVHVRPPHEAVLVGQRVPGLVRDDPLVVAELDGDRRDATAHTDQVAGMAGERLGDDEALLERL